MKRKWAMYWAFVAVGATSQSVLGQPEPGWSDQFATGDLNGGVVRCMAVFDEDGPGPGLPSLFAGGSFRTAGVGGPWVGAIARWDGMRWTDVGGSASSVSSGSPYTGVLAMTVFDEDGPGPIPESLYVAGYGFAINGQGGVFRWDGTAWTPVCAPPCFHPAGPIYDLAVYDDDGSGPGLPKLFAAGRIETGIWCWNGTQWSPADESVYVTGGQVNALVTFDEDGPGPLPAALYAGGDFRWWHPTAPLQMCAKWDGNTWSQIGDGLSGWIDDLAVFDPDGDYPGQGYLYATGYIRLADYTGYQRHVRWDGNTWSPVPGVGQTYSDKLGVFDVDGERPLPRLLVTNKSETYPGGVALWSGFEWSPLQTVLRRWDNSDVTSFGMFDDDGDGGRDASFFAGGGFWGDLDTVSGFIQWDGTEFVGVGNGLWRGPHALRAIDPDGNGPRPEQLYAFGYFYAAGSSITQSVAVWNGEEWNSLGNIENPVNVYTVEAVNFGDDTGGTPQIVVGGDFRKINEIAATNVALWDGKTWVPVANTMTSQEFGGLRVLTLQTFDEDGVESTPPPLYVGGVFSSVDGIQCENIARWDGYSWSRVGSGVTAAYGASVDSLTEWQMVDGDPRSRVLVVGGYFDQAGGAPASGIAAWNGEAWMPVGDAKEGGITSLVVVWPEDSAAVPEGLYVSGYLRFADERRYQGIARYENGTWSLVAGAKSPDGFDWTPVGGIDNASAKSMKVFDEDGPGGNPPHLLALGAFQFVGDNQSHSLLRWDGHQWTGFARFAARSWLDARSLAVFDEDADGPNPPGLYIGGQFNSVDGIQSVGIARWGLRVPYIVRQPASLQRGVDESALFNVKAGGGDSLQYRWRLDGQDLADGERFSGTATETLRISSIRLNDRGQYDVAITNSAGIKISRAAQLDVSCRSARVTPDLNRDHFVDGHDVQTLVDAISISESSDAGVCAADLNADGVLSELDIEILVSALLQ